MKSTSSSSIEELLNGSVYSSTDTAPPEPSALLSVISTRSSVSVSLPIKLALIAPPFPVA